MSTSDYKEENKFYLYKRIISEGATQWRSD